jgi:hypothetical protein
VKRLLYLAMVALVAMLILVPVALAQEGTLPKTGGQEQTVMVEQEMKMEGTAPLPPSGGPPIGFGAVALPAAALLIGAGVLGYAVLRRR